MPQIKYYKLMLVRMYDSKRDETFYAVYTTAYKKDFKAAQILDIAFGEILKDTPVAFSALDGKFTVGDVVYVNNMGWMKIVRK